MTIPSLGRQRKELQGFKVTLLVLEIRRGCTETTWQKKFIFNRTIFLGIKTVSYTTFL